MVKTIVTAAIAVIIIRMFLFQPFLVSGASMEPNVSQSNYLIIDELTYRFREPARGEVVVFWYPGDTKTAYIKRVLGLPGERIQINGGIVRINGAALDESSYLKNKTMFTTIDVTLGPNEYFVMGDNRGNSYDSRSWGPLEREYIIGIARLRLYPFWNIGILKQPHYNFI